MKTRFTTWTMMIAIFIAGISFTSCPNRSRPVSRADYSRTMVGNWQGTVGNVKETMSIKGDGTFICQLQPAGFIATMLFPKAPGTIRGAWKITDDVITLNITGEKNERLENIIALSRIVSFKKDELVLKSDRGDTSTFLRTRDL